MTDVDRSPFEVRLERRLRAFASVPVGAVDAEAVARRVVRRGGRRLSAGWLAVAVVAGVLLAGLVALGIGAIRLPSLEPLPTNPLLSGSSDYDAVVLREVDGPRGIEVVAVRPDRPERVIRRLNGESYTTYGSVSQGGWLAWDATSRGKASASDSSWGLINLGDPRGDPRFVDYVPALGGAWGPRGLFATTSPGIHTCCSVQTVDASNGTTTDLGNLGLPGSGPDIIWADDGSGIVVGHGDGGFGIAGLNGVTVPGLPLMAPAMGERWLAPGGRTVRLGLVTAQGVTVGGVEWYNGQLAPAVAHKASFSRDGRSLWLLLDRAQGARHVAEIARLDEPGRPEVVTSVDVGTDVAHLWFRGLSPDDSIFAINIWTGPIADPTPGDTVLVDRAGHSVVLSEENVVGFVPSSLADTW
jgi:hypothetical protein